jgi:hypothetical protein
LGNAIKVEINQEKTGIEILVHGKNSHSSDLSHNYFAFSRQVI